MRHHGGRHQEIPRRNGAQDGRQDADGPVIEFLSEEIEEDDRPGGQEWIDQPRRAEKKPKHQQKRVARRINAVPSPVVDDVGKIERFFVTRRRGREPAGQE
jgi:hypothetical protein